MIRINLLPVTARRRRRSRPGRERGVLALMCLGWAALLITGWLWIAATEAEIAELRGQTTAVVRDRDAVRRSFDERALVDREQALQREREALAQLSTARRTPAPVLAELAQIFGAGADGPPLAGGALALRELRELEDGRWLLVASAADLPALTELLRRISTSGHFAAVGQAEYARDDDGRLALSVTLTARE